MKLFCASLFVLISATVFAQKADTAATDSSQLKTSALQIGVRIGNTANYYGQTSSEKLPYLSGDISYQHKSGWWTAAALVKLVDYSQAISELDVALGYDIDITKKLGGRFSYTRSFFPKDSPLPQAINPNTLSGSLMYDFKWLQSSLNGDYVFGNLKDDNGNSIKAFYLSETLSKSINLGSLFSKNYNITLDPSINFTAGTQFLVDSIKVRKVLSQEERLNLREQIKKIRQKDTRFDGGKRLGETTQYIYSTSFDYLTTTLSLPLAYNRAHYTVEAAYQLSIPSKKFEELTNKTQSFFTLSFTYVFYKDK